MRRSLCLVALLAVLPAAAEDFTTPDEVTELIHKHHYQVESCYRLQHQAHPELSGALAVHWFIDAEGNVSSPELQEGAIGVGGVELGDCVIEHLVQWKFQVPRGAERISVNYRWALKGAAILEDEAPLVVPVLDPRPIDPKEEQRLAEEAERERDQYEREHPPGLAELWSYGGAGMYPILLALMLGLGAGAVSLVLALVRSQRGAVVVAGIALGAAAAGLSAGCLGYVNGMMGAYSAVANVNPADQAIIMRVANKEASVCWKFGALAAIPGTALAAAALASALRARRPANV